METVDFYEKSAKYAKMSLCRVKIKSALKRQISTFHLISFCVDLLLPIWIKFVKNDFVYFEFEFFHF